MNNKIKELFKKFVYIFPSFEESIRAYSPFEHCGIKMETEDRKLYIFIYRNDNDWSFQTYKNYIDNENSFLRNKKGDHYEI